MLPSSQQRLLRWLSRIHDLLMVTYPSAFRHEFGHEMSLAFNNRAKEILQRDGRWALLPFMFHIVLDWLHTVVRETRNVETNSRLIARINDVAAASSVGLNNMVTTPYPDPDRQSRAVSLMLTAVGLFLLVVGWFQWMTLKGFL